MAPRLIRPAVNATMTLCSRTVTGDQSVAVQVANHQPFQLVNPRSPLTIQPWADMLEIDVLIGFNVDPKKYKAHIHDLTAPGLPCPEGQELRILKSFANNQVATGPYEVHFVLRDDVSAPSIEELRKWQRSYAEVAKDPSPSPATNVFALCKSRHHVANIAVGSLLLPPKTDVERTLLHALSLESKPDFIKQNLGIALKIDLKGKEVKFHLGRDGGCTNLREIEELVTIDLDETDVVRLHISSSTAR